MVDRTSSLSISHQCRLLGISRSSLYYKRRLPRDSRLQAMQRISDIHMHHSNSGARMLHYRLRREGYEFGLYAVRSMMRKLGVRAIHPTRCITTVRNKSHRVYPYLLRSKALITHSNQVWAMDITYIPTKQGWLYLCSVIDWFSRCLLSWRLSNTMEAGLCVETFQTALRLHGTPKIVNTDQGSQFTSDAFKVAVRRSGSMLSMDGKGAWRDNVIIERFWRSLKYECIHGHDLESTGIIRRAISDWICYYNHIRPHRSLGGATPAEVFAA